MRAAEWMFVAGFLVAAVATSLLDTLLFVIGELAMILGMVMYAVRMIVYQIPNTE